MSQSFEDNAEPQATAPRLAALRTALAGDGLAGFLVPRSDEFQGEYVAAHAERLKWLTGFSGSAGLAIVLKDKAAIFVDGRYTLQVREQVDGGLFDFCHLVDTPPAKWLEAHVGPGDAIGYDPWLVTLDQAERYRKAVEAAGGSFRPVAGNPVDAIWTGQPDRPSGPVAIQPLQYAGRAAADKLEDLRAALAEENADAVLISLTDSVSWLFNIRGRDVAHTPVVQAYAIVERDGPAHLFIAADKLDEDVAAHLGTIAAVAEPDTIAAVLDRLATAGKAVLVDPAWAPSAAVSALEAGGAKIVRGTDPCILPKARKTAAEQNGARAAHRRDGAAMVRFLCWLEGAAEAGGLDEIAVVERLEAFRRETGELMDISFDSISGAGPHAAIPHYRVSSASNRRLECDQIYLIDSGGQYRDGTTDITRTVIVGRPTAEMRDRFTRVLKGMIGLSTVRFPPGTTGGHLDALARQALWAAGLDFDHGTGHGVGSYLSVHEGPARFSKADRTALEAGMILSNEPGYYKAGEYGIRIENLLLVREAEAIEGGERPMHRFETLTLCPIDLRLVEPALLSEVEAQWLEAYHARVRKEIGPLVGDDERAWLARATRGPAGPARPVGG